MTAYQPEPLGWNRDYTDEEMLSRSKNIYTTLRTRRTVRDFSNRAVPLEVIQQCILTAGTAPSGANRQPWHFVVVTKPEVKKKIRIAAEKEEEAFYDHRAPQDWLDALSEFGTNAQKPFLETAPYLIAIFAETKSPIEDGFQKNYYVSESVGISTGMLITALHQAGLATLTHTPSPMGFLNEVLKRPKHEKPFLLLVIGKPADDAQVPAITKKSLSEIASFC